MCVRCRCRFFRCGESVSGRDQDGGGLREARVAGSLSSGRNTLIDGLNELGQNAGILEDLVT